MVLRIGAAVGVLPTRGVQLRMVTYKSALRSAQSRLWEIEKQMARVVRLMQPDVEQVKKVRTLKRQITEREAQLAKMQAEARKQPQVTEGAKRAMAKKHAALKRMGESLRKMMAKKKTVATLRSEAKELRKEAAVARKQLAAAKKKEAEAILRKHSGPVSPYSLFVAKETKGKVAPVMKELAAKWKGMSEEQKKPFGEEAKRNSTKRSELRKEVKAGRKLSAYQRFFAERMPGAYKAVKAKHGTDHRKAIAEAAREVGVAWKALRV